MLLSELPTCLEITTLKWAKSVLCVRALCTPLCGEHCVPDENTDHIKYLSFDYGSFIVLSFRPSLGLVILYLSLQSAGSTGRHSASESN